MKTTRAQRQRLKTENAKRPKGLTEVPRAEWPNDGADNRVNVYISRDYLVQVFEEEGAIRLSVNKTTMCADGRWSADLQWDELQAIKQEIGFGSRYAIEVYPKDCDVVNVANMRHLWVLRDPLDIGWTAHSAGSAKESH